MVSAIPQKAAGSPESVKTPEKWKHATVRTSAIEQSPLRSAWKHASVLGISDQTIRQIFHCDLCVKLHP